MQETNVITPQNPFTQPFPLFGTGAPSVVAGEGTEYYDTGSGYAKYVYHSGAWHATAGGGGGSPGGSSGQVQYNNAGSFGGISNVTTNGTNIALGTPLSGVLTNCTALPLTTGVTGVLGAANGGTGVANSKNLTVLNALTLSGTDSTVMTFPSTSATIARTDAANTFTGIQTFSTPIAATSLATMTATVGGAVPTPPNNTTTFLRGDGTFAAPAGSGIAIGTTTITGGTTTRLLYDNAGVVGEITGATSNGTALTLVAPVLGTPASGTLTNCTGLPISTGVSSLGTGVATLLGGNSSGTGGPAGTTSPSFTTPILGVAAGTSLALGGATIGGNALAITGTTALQGTTVSGASLTLSGNQSAAAWTTSGIQIKGVAATLTDTSSSGTVATAYTNVLGGNTIAASSATTYTNYFSTYLTDPVAGGNVTFTNKWALGADSAKIANTLNVPVGADGGGGTFPSISFGAALNSGLSQNGSFGIRVVDRGTTVITFNSGAITINSNYNLIWGGRGSFQFNSDTAIYNTAAATMRQGFNNSATPIAQTFVLGESSRPGTDSNIAGAKGTIQAGLGTGPTGGGGPFTIQTAPANAAGTTATNANVYADRLAIAGKQVTLTASSATTVLNQGVAASTGAGGTLYYTIFATDGTDFQSRSGYVDFAAVNKAGTVTVGLGTPAEAVGVSSGTLTVTVTAVANGAGVDFKLNAVSSLTTTSLYAYVTSINHGTGTVTFQ